MADNVSYTPGSGVNIAADDVGGVLHQRVKISVGADGTAADASATNPLPVAGYGELVECLEAIRMAMSSVARVASWLRLDTSGRPNIVFDTSSSINQCSQLLRAGALNFDVGQAYKDFSVLTADNLRRNITVT
jgi:hypothetical protein